MGVTELLSRLNRVRATGQDRWCLPLPPLEYLHECFWLDDAGVLRWRKRPEGHFRSRSKQWNGRYANTVVGTIDVDYRTVGLLGKRFLVSRIVFALTNSADPGDMFIDHINGNSLDDRPENLRTATNAQNVANASRVRRGSRSGVRNVSYNKRLGKWVVTVGPDKSRRHIGVFKSLVDAKVAAQLARERIFGPFAGSG